MRKQDSMECLSSWSKAPPICAITTRIMQTPWLSPQNQYADADCLPFILRCVFALQRYLINWKNGMKEDKELPHGERNGGVKTIS